MKKQINKEGKKNWMVFSDDKEVCVTLWHKDGKVSGKAGKVYKGGKLADTKGEWEQLVIELER